MLAAMVLVTGANGFIGSALVWELNQAGEHNIICVDTVSLEQRAELLSSLKFNHFVHTESLFTFLNTDPRAKQLTGVFHMGACSSTTETDVEFLRKNNTEYTQRLFEFCTLLNVPFIYASSAAVYGDGSHGFSEDTAVKRLKPLNPYGWSKLNFDQWAVQQTQSPPRWYGLRFFNVFGPNEYHKNEMSSVAFKAYQQIKSTGSLTLFRSHHSDYKDGEQMRDFIFVKDCTRWMMEIFRDENVSSGIYNMGFGKARTWLDLAHAVFASMDKKVQINWVDTPVHIRQQYQYYTCADMAKFSAQGLTPAQWPLELGVKDYVQNYLQKPNPYLVR